MPEKPPVTAYSYRRFSSKKQERGDSLRRQTEATKRFCERHGLPLSDATFEDLGISAWKGANAETGALAAFLSAVASGKVKRGSILVVESLDRISRQSARKALRVCEQIVEAGVTIATLSPERFYDAKALDETFGLIEMLLTFVRANEESETKSKRIKAAWAKKRAKNELAGGKLPAWLSLNNEGKALVNKPAAKVISDIVKMCADGCGAPAILKKLNSEGVTNPASGKPRWSLSYVQLLMRDRRLIGEFQPCDMIDGRRVPIGQPIEGYYPAIIDLATFMRAQTAIEQRRRHCVTKTGNTINLFSGLMHDPITGTKWVVGKKAAHKPAMLQTMAHRNRFAKGLSIAYDAVEEVILSDTLALETERLAPQQTDLAEAQAAVVDLEKRIATISEKMEEIESEAIGPLVTTVATLQKRLNEKRASLDELRSLSRSHGALPNIVEEMRGAKGIERIRQRQRLRTHLASIIERIDIRCERVWRHTVGICDIYYRTGDYRRSVTHYDYVVWKLKRPEKFDELLRSNLPDVAAEHRKPDAEDLRCRKAGKWRPLSGFYVLSPRTVVWDVVARDFGFDPRKGES